jgi:hypothetical protein
MVTCIFVAFFVIEVLVDVFMLLNDRAQSPSLIRRKTSNPGHLLERDVLLLVLK